MLKHLGWPTLEVPTQNSVLNISYTEPHVLHYPPSYNYLATKTKIKNNTAFTLELLHHNHTIIIQPQPSHKLIFFSQQLLETETILLQHEQ